MTGETIKQLLEQSGTAYADQVALQIKRQGTYQKTTYAELYNGVRRLGTILRSLDVQPGERIAILGENRPEWAMAYLAVTCGGMVAVPLDRLLKPAEQQRLLADSGVKALFFSGAFLAALPTLTEGLSELGVLICMDSVPEQDNILSWQALLESPPHHLDTAQKAYWSTPVTPEDLAAIIYTSGTTGNPKGVMLSHGNIMANVASCDQALPYGPGDNFLSVLPLHHTFECTAGFLSALYAGATVTYAESLKSRDILNNIRETGVTVILGVPLLYEKMYAGIMRAVRSRPPHVRAMFHASRFLVQGARTLFGLDLGPALFRRLREKGGLGSIRFFVSGAAALSPEISRGFESLGFKILQGYGLTESAPVLSVNPLGAAKPDSVGPAVPRVELRIDNPDRNGVGEILARGPNIMAGYYKNPLATQEVLRDGWLYTGDLGWIDEDQHLHIVGRQKNVIVTQSGKNVYPEEIEGVLMASPYIAEVVVIGQVDPETRREVVKAIAVPAREQFEQEAKQRGQEFSEAEMEQIVRQEIRTRCTDLSEYKRVKIREVRWEELPKTSTRKIKRFLLKSQSA